MTEAHPTPAPLDAESLFTAWVLRVEAGEDAPFDEVLTAHPDLATELQQLHADWQLFAPLLCRVVPGLVASDAAIAGLSPLSELDAGSVDLPSQELLDRLRIELPNSGRYKFRAVIGRGGGGVVLKVWDSKLFRSLAMKVVLGRGEERPSGDTPRVDGRTLARFVDEARIASQLNHPGIVPVHELGADGSGRAFFTMKLVKGEDLSAVFARVRSGSEGWNETRALGVLLRACEAMAFAHEKGVVHRDLKPANLMVGRHGEVYVMDWGLARVMGEPDHRDLRWRQPTSASLVDSLRKGERDATPDSPLVTMDGTVVGTPAYMSPEQARGQLELVGPSTDVYALGAMLYELLAGEPPYLPPGARLSPHTVLARVLDGPPRPLAELAPEAPLELVAICERAMEREAARRYPDVRALADDLRAYLERRVVAAYESGTWAETRKWVLRNRGLAGSIAATILALVTGMGLSLTFKSRADRNAMVATERLLERDRQSRIAIENAKSAESARIQAETQASAAQKQLYIASITGAASALFHEEYPRARHLLAQAPQESRGWEWSYLMAQMDTSLLSRKGGYNDFSSDSEHLVIANGEDLEIIGTASM
ncbi:MAG: serine/threonine protein kinase, partial [Planctomycetes bacterium]|nr:serine/threonine protein kinase [Planctomycetota bacterium]